MAQKQTNFKKATCKGDVGERIVIEFLEKNGYQIYKSIREDQPHSLDFLAIKNGKITALDVKTKARFNFAPETGIDVRHYRIYENISEKNKIPFAIFFVDECLGEVYGNFISKFKEFRIINTKYGEKIVAWPLSSMEKVKKLTEEEIEEIKSFQQRNYEFETHN
jgi:hypothetical protein